MLHAAPINRIALTGRLRQLLKQHLEATGRAHRRGGGIIDVVGETGLRQISHPADAFEPIYA